MTLESKIINLFIERNYLLLFILLLAEGPIIGFTASNLASLGFLNIFLVCVVYFLGDFVGDILHYLFGLLLAKAHNRFLKKKFKKLKDLFESKQILSLDELLEKNFFLALIVIKLTPPISSLGLISLGARKTNFLKFIKNTAIICLLVEIPIVLFGYFAGITADVFLKSRNIYERITFFILTVFIFIYLLKIFKRYLSKKIIKNKKVNFISS